MRFPQCFCLQFLRNNPILVSVYFGNYTFISMNFGKLCMFYFQHCQDSRTIPASIWTKPVPLWTLSRTIPIPNWILSQAMLVPIYRNSDSKLDFVTNHTCSNLNLAGTLYSCSSWDFVMLVRNSAYYSCSNYNEAKVGQAFSLLDLWKCCICIFVSCCLFYRLVWFYQRQEF